jgi:hypothetical protein
MILTLPMTDEVRSITLDCTHKGTDGVILRNVFSVETNSDRNRPARFSRYVSNVEANRAPWSLKDAKAAIDGRGVRLLPRQIVMVMEPGS